MASQQRTGNFQLINWYWCSNQGYLYCSGS